LGSIGSGAEDCASAPSHTTGRAVFRIQRLNAAASFMVRRGQMEPQTRSGGERHSIVPCGG
ncbi:MAG TPA: hypothetical protein VIU38_00590, partial [Anaerolineales bacterium]